LPAPGSSASRNRRCWRGRASICGAAGRHVNQCGDWETSAAFWKLTRSHGEAAALKHLAGTYNDLYPSKGMVFAMGTVKARPRQWLLLGVIRLNELNEEQKRQGTLAL
jgi:hypothetical protein